MHLHFYYTAKWCAKCCVKSLHSRPTLHDPMEPPCQAPLSMAFSRQNTGVGCHALFQGIFLTDGKINLWVHQRSCDVPLGLPFNVTQYAVLQSLIAHVTGLKVGTLSWNIKDAHIYVNQVDGIKEQIARFDEKGDLKAPKLWINPDVKDFFKIDNSLDLKDIKIEGYEHMGPIRFPLAQ